MDEIYSDGVGRVERMGGVVKLDLISFVPGTRDDEDRHGAEVCARLVLHPQGLARLHAAMRDLYAQIERAGLVRRDGGEEPGPRPVGPAAAG